jgi:C4-dicarboxylate-binding protein DctP
MNVKIKYLLLGLAAAIFSLSATASPIVIKFSHVVAVDTPKGRAAEFFKRRAEELTNNRVKIEVYPNSTLYNDKEGLEALQIGSIQMLAPSLAKFGPLGVKGFEVFDLPYIFNSYEDLHKVTQGNVGQSLLDRLEPKGIKGLAYWDNGFKVFSSNKPITTVDDFKGQKMRIQSSKILDAQMRSIGVLPQVMAFSEVYQALQTGVVDGTENPPSNLYTKKMHEVQKYVRVSNHGYLGYALITNKKFWDGLPEDVRTLLEQAVLEATEYGNRIAKQKNDDDLQAVRDSGKCQVFTPTVEEQQAMKKSMVKMHEKMGRRVGPDLVQQIYNATGFNPSVL